MEGREVKAKPPAPIFPNTVATFAAGPLDQSRDPELFVFVFVFLLLHIACRILVP